MRIERLHIEGFGHYSDRPIDAFDSALTVVRGKQEAGKSTLFAFMRAVLFGFPTRLSRDHYRPLRGGRHGGRIVLRLDDGRGFTVERFQGPGKGSFKAHSEDGDAIDEATFNALIGHASEALFRSAFTFDLDDLPRFNDAEGDLGALLYGASTGAAQLPQVHKRLDGRIERLFKPGGSTQEINRILGEMGTANTRLREVDGQADDYRRMTERQDQIVIGLEVAQERLSEQEHLWQEAGRQSRAWQDWTSLRGLDQRLALLEDTGAFPHDGKTRLERAEHYLRDLKSVRDKATTFLANARLEAGHPVHDANLLDSADAIDGLQDDRTFLEKLIDDLPARQRELTSREEALQGQLKMLGSDWNEERLVAFDTSIPRRAEIEQWQGQLDELRADQRYRDRDFEDASRQSNGPTEARPPRWLTAAATVAGAIIAAGAVATAVAGELLVTAALGLLGAIAFAAATALRPGSSRVINQAPHRQQEAAKAVNVARALHDQAVLEWDAWLRASDLPTRLTPPTALELLQSVIVARGKAEELPEWRSRVRAIRGSIQECRDRLEPIAGILGLELPTDDRAVAGMANSIIVRFKKAEDEQRKQDQALIEVTKCERADAQAEEKVVEAEQGLADILAAAGVKTPEAFYARAAIHEERSELKRDRGECELRLQQVIGPGPEALAALNESLSTTTPEEIEAAVAAAKAEVEETKERRDELLDERGQVTAKIQGLHNDDTASEARSQIASLTTEMKVSAREWSSLVVARALLVHTRERYERERQPAVIQRASEFFSHMTDGRYPRLYQPVGESTVTVEDSDGATKKPEELSRATKEQVYLALRLGAIEEVISNQEGLPVIIDEVLVNFDPERARRAVEAFVQLAKHTQVIVFTCHPWIAELFESVAGKPPVIALD
jgi:uncharacterized protein YhaN